MLPSCTMKEESRFLITLGPRDFSEGIRPCRGRRAATALSLTPCLTCDHAVCVSSHNCHSDTASEDIYCLSFSDEESEGLEKDTELSSTADYTHARSHTTHTHTLQHPPETPQLWVSSDASTCTCTGRPPHTGVLLSEPPGGLCATAHIHTCLHPNTHPHILVCISHIHPHSPICAHLSLCVLTRPAMYILTLTLTHTYPEPSHFHAHTHSLSHIRSHLHTPVLHTYRFLCLQ